MADNRPTDPGYGNYAGPNNYYYGYNYGVGGPGGGGEGGPARSLRDYLLMLRERIWLVIVAFFIIFTGSILYTLHAPKEYTATATVRILRDDPDILRVGGGIEDNTIRSMEDFNTEVSVFQSQMIITQVASRLRGEELAEFMAPYEDMIRFTGPLTPAEVLYRNRKIVPMRMTLMLAVQYSHPDPQIAARIANLFAEEFQNHKLRQNIETSMEAVESLQVRVDSQQEKVEALENKMAAYREQYGIVSLEERADIDHQELAELKRIVVADKRMLDETETRWTMLQNRRAEGKPLWELSFISQLPRVSELLSQASSLRVTESTLARRYRAKHPRMIETRESLEKALSELNEAVEEAAQKTYLEYLHAQRSHDQSSQRLAEKEREILELGRLQVDYGAIRREMEANTGILQVMVMRLNTEITEINLKAHSARIIDVAHPPRDPSKPRYVLNIAAGFFGGIASGLALALIVALLDDRVKSVFDVESSIGLPLVGVVPRIKRLNSPEKAKAVASNIDQRVTEAFRSIHSALKISEQSKDAKVILATSTVPSEGKSFVTTNLAVTYAIHGQKTLLIDADLRMPSVSKGLDLDESKGLITHFEKGEDLDACIHREVYPNMDVLCAGGRAKNPSQILSSESFEAMITQLRESYDRIIIDSPPVAAVSDVLNILSCVDGLVYVIKFNSVKRRTVKSNVKRLLDANVPIFGAVLNQISVAASRSYYTNYYDTAYSQYYETGEEDGQEDLPALTPSSEKDKAVATSSAGD